MSKINQVKSYIEKANEIYDGSTRFFSEFLLKARAEKNAISSDRDLNEDAKTRRKTELAAKQKQEFMKLAHTRKQEFVVNLQKARKLADEIVYAAAPKPAPRKLERFEAELRSLKTELLFTANQRHGYEKLADFVRKIDDDAYLAGIVRDEFGALSAQIMSAKGTDEIKFESPTGDGNTQRPIKAVMAEMYRRLKDDYESQDVREARQLLRDSDASIASPKLFNAAIMPNESNGFSGPAVELFGKNDAYYINDTDTYFEKFPEQRPADYIDPEAEKPKQSGSIDWGDDGVKEVWQAAAEARKAREAAEAEAAAQ